MESRPRTPVSPLSPSEIKVIQDAIKVIQVNVKDLMVMMTPGFKRKFDPDLSPIHRLVFNEGATTVKEVSEFISLVNTYLEDIAMIANPTTPACLDIAMPASQMLLIKEADLVMSCAFFKSINVSIAIIQELTGPWINYMINLSALKQREQDMIPVDALIKSIACLVDETKKRVEEGVADRLRLQEMQFLQERLESAIIKNPKKLSPKQLLTDCCTLIESSIKSIRESKYGGYSTTGTKLKELLTKAKQYALKQGEVNTEDEISNVRMLLGVVRQCLDEKFNDCWVERNKSTGIPLMRDLIVKPIDEKEKWDQIKALAATRINAKTLLGYPIITRHEETGDFYFHITKSNLEGLNALLKQFEQDLQVRPQVNNAI